MLELTHVSRRANVLSLFLPPSWSIPSPSPSSSIIIKERKNEGSRIAPAKQKRPSLICHLLQMMVGWSRCQIEQVLISPLSLWLGKNIHLEKASVCGGVDDPTWWQIQARPCACAQCAVSLLPLLCTCVVPLLCSASLASTV